MSKHLGDFDASTVVYGKFSTFRPSTGAAFTLGGTPALSVYKDNSTTQSTTGVTLTADFDSVTGLNHFAIDTSADGTFYAAGSFFDIVITTGTVDSVSVVGSVVASFTIRKNSALKPATAGRTLVVDAAGLADANMVKAGPTGSGTAQTARDIGGAVPAAAAGASGGLLISGSNSGTTTLGALTITGVTTHTGNVVLSDGLTISAPSTGNRAGITITGNGTGAAISATGGATGQGLLVAGGGTSGDGIKVTTTVGHGINLAPVGTDKHGLFATGGNGGTSDGIKAAAGTGGVDFRANQTGNLTGNVSGSVGSVTGLTASDVGSIKTKTDFLPSATAGAAGGVFIAGTNAATTVTTSFTTTFTGNLTGNVGGNVTGSIGSLATQAKADVNAEADTALADYDGPTHTELTAELATADDATLAAIAALNNLSAAQVNAEVDTALADINLDHLVKAAVDTDFATTVHLNSVIGHIADNGTTATFDRTTDSQEAIRDRGDAAWITATGFSTHSAADVWAVGTRLLTAGTNIVLAKGTGVTGFNDLSAAQVNAEVDTALADYDGPTHAELTAELATADDATLAAIAALNNLSAAGVRSAVGLATANLDTQLDALPTNAELATALASADDAALAAIAGLNNLSAAQVNAEVDTALADVGLTTTITGRIDAAISSRLATGGYTAPDNMSITAIKTQTDKFTFTVPNQCDVNIQYVNDVQVNGDGSPSTPWGP